MVFFNGKRTIPCWGSPADLKSLGTGTPPEIAAETLTASKKWQNVVPFAFHMHNKAVGSWKMKSKKIQE